jgi:hypothetical protein
MAKKQKEINNGKNLKWELRTREIPIEYTEAEAISLKQSYAETNANIELLLNHAINGLRLSEMVILQFNMRGGAKKLFNDVSRCFNRAGDLICSSVDYEMSKKIRDGISNNYETGILDNMLNTYVQLNDAQRNILDNCGYAIKNGINPIIRNEVEPSTSQLNELFKVMQESLGIIDQEKRLSYIKSKGFSIKVVK